MSLPNFLCIGAQKAGTTWLYEMLVQNPAIWLPPVKELHFFDKMDASKAAKEKRRAKFRKAIQREKRGRARNRVETVDSTYLKSLTKDDILTVEWYKRIFTHPDAVNRVSGEVTPGYLDMAEENVAFARQLLGNVKLILIVREARARTLSQISMGIARSGNNPETKEDWERWFGKAASNQRGDYRTSIPNWLKHFDRENLLVLPFGDVRDRPADLIRQIEDFIGAVPFGGYKSLTETVHKTKKVVIPDWVSERVAETVACQNEYLAETFGEEFFKRTK